ncbi:MAG: AMP-binding protein [Desulfovibrionaceae bacterium]
MPTDFETVQALMRSLGQWGDRPALLWFDDGGRREMSYARLGRLCSATARGLARRGLNAGERVVLFADNDWRTVALAGAVNLAGAVVVPVDPQFAGETLAHVLRDADPALMLGPEAQVRAGREALGQGAPPWLRTDVEDGEDSWRSLLEEESEAGPSLPDVLAKDTAALFYTSGTTGAPKGVPLSHANLVFQQKAIVGAGLVGPEDRMLLPLPLHHVYPYVVGVMASLALGTALVLPSSLTGRGLVQAMREGEASIVLGVPRLYEALTSNIRERMASGGFLSRRLGPALLGASVFARRRLGLRLGRVLLPGLHKRMGERLRIMASGGAPLPPELAWTLEGLGWSAAIGYGLTETSPILCLEPPGGGHFKTVGEPLPGVGVRIDEQAGGPEGAGEIQASGPGVFEGYRNLPDKTREVFTGDGWLRTGDLGRMEQGRLVVEGRLSSLIVTRGGENVRPDAVEAVLDAHPLLRETGVLERDGRLAVLAAPDIPAARERGLDPEEAARRAVAEASRGLPSYQRPTEIAVSMDGLERTRLGKIRRHKLEERFDQVQAGGDDHSLRPLPKEEMTPDDRKLLDDGRAAAVWELLAGRYPERRLFPDSDLAADLGVDSMEWLDLSMALAERAGLDMGENDIAELATVRDLMQAAARSSGAGEGRPDPVEQPEAYLDEEIEQRLQPTTGGRLAVYRGLHAAARGLFRLLFRLQVQGVEQVSRARGDGRPVVFAPNHLSYLDPLLLAAALPFDALRDTHFLGWREAAFSNALTSFFADLAQTAPADPARRPGQALAVGATLLERGRNLVWFPEGMRSPSGELGAFRPGLGRILLRRNALVVPVVIRGTREAMPPGRWRISPARINLRFGEPVEAQALRPQGDCEDAAGCVMESLRRRMTDMEPDL